MYKAATALQKRSDDDFFRENLKILKSKCSFWKYEVKEHIQQLASKIVGQEDNNRETPSQVATSLQNLDVYDPRDLLDIEDNSQNADENLSSKVEKELEEYEKFNRGYSEWRSGFKDIETPNKISYLAEKFWRDHTSKWPSLAKIAKQVTFYS